MPRRSKGPRLYLDPKRKQWVIRDGQRFIRTGAGERDSDAAEKYLAQYIGHKHKPEASSAPMIADVLAVYGEEVAPHRRTASTIGYKIGKLLEWWGDKRVSDISENTCRAYVKERGNTGAGADLKTLRSAVGYWDKSEQYGPLARMPKFWMPEEPEARERWLTRSEAARLLRAARPYQHIRRLILLGLYTGSRPGVILALDWSQIDLRSGVLIRARGAQAKNKRSPRAKLGWRILAHLRRWHRLDGGKGPVCYLEDKWHPGKRIVEDPHGAWAKVIKASGLEGVTRHTLRHTRATWMAQKGVKLFEAAGFLGMSVRTLERVYAHHDPEHQEHAANIGHIVLPVPKWYERAGRKS
jgi:integrase